MAEWLRGSMAITKEMARQFAIILSSGVPGSQAIAYFYPDDNPTSHKAWLDKWMRDPEVQKQILILQGKAWEERTIEEKIQYAIDKHYTEVAYFLYSHNYAELVGADKTKADTCRQVLETKLAGMAGKMDALTQFWQDINTGKIKLSTPAKTGATPAAELGN